MSGVNTLSAKNPAVSSYVWNKLGLQKENKEENTYIKQQINNFNSKVSQKWTTCKRSIGTNIFISLI